MSLLVNFLTRLLVRRPEAGFFPPRIVMAERSPVMPDYMSGPAVTMETPGTNTIIEVTATKKRIPR